ncbi:hypothetical protein DFJ58DRAFT_836351 [Suillus subalutaceus]|uniref:uncharacterized protein n=1 Tax=Suillus subalutaceus TaxID=48586 RepID=UPI001B8772A5|nr:uncharacterized protein DFJ58DRAFT_836351 [Suillus subalutaceus]KAG1874607.1 hypothetical protein DFJ58DRAFT_836351 [Suillus subalutaceus]
MPCATKNAIDPSCANASPCTQGRPSFLLLFDEINKSLPDLVHTYAVAVFVIVKYLLAGGKFVENRWNMIGSFDSGEIEGGGDGGSFAFANSPSARSIRQDTIEKNTAGISMNGGNCIRGNRMHTRAKARGIKVGVMMGCGTTNEEQQSIHAGTR